MAGRNLFLAHIDVSVCCAFPLLSDNRRFHLTVPTAAGIMQLIDFVLRFLRGGHWSIGTYVSLTRETVYGLQYLVFDRFFLNSCNNIHLFTN